MVGLSVVLEGHKSHLEHVINKNIAINGNTTDRRDQQPLVVNATSNKAMVIHHTSLLSPSTPPISPVNDGSSAPSANPRSLPGGETEWFNSFPQPSAVFLDRCSLCGTRLVLGRDIYMYKGDRGFCSVECRSRQIILDEQADKRIKQKQKKKTKTKTKTKQGHS